MVIVTVLALLLAVGVVWMLWEAKHAPLGWEDEQGFHLGKEPE